MEETQELPNQVDIEMNDNTTAYNHNVAIRITDAKRDFSVEELTKMAMDRLMEARRMLKNEFKC